MKREIEPPRNTDKKKPQGADDAGAPESGREAGDEALQNASPTDERADEKVIVNEQWEDKVVNAPTESGLSGSEEEFES